MDLIHLLIYIIRTALRALKIGLFVASGYNDPIYRALKLLGFSSLYYQHPLSLFWAYIVLRHSIEQGANRNADFIDRSY